MPKQDNRNYVIEKYKKNQTEENLSEVILAHKELIFYIINRYYHDNLFYEKIDYYQLIAMQFKGWTNNFIENKNCTFLTYIYSCIRNFLLKEIRKEVALKRKNINNIYFDQEIVANNSQKYVDIIKDEEDFVNTYLEKAKQEIIYDELKNLLGEEAKYYIAYLEGKKGTELVDLFKMEYPKIRNKISYLKRKVKENKHLFQNLIQK